MKYTVQIVGVGGQGVLLASMVIGNAAMAEGLEVAMSEVHGMAQRGGSVLSTIRMGEGILSPLEADGNADLILGFEPVETFRAIRYGNEGTDIVMNLNPMIPVMVSMGVEEYPPVEELEARIREVSGRVITINATERAVEAGKAIAANAVLIGAVAGVEGFPIQAGRLKQVLLDTVPQKFREINERAFDLGRQAVRGD